MNIADPLPDFLRQKYRGLRHLLGANTEILEMMADIEADLLHLMTGECQFRESVIALLERTLLLVEDLDLLSEGRYRELFGIQGKIEAEIRDYLRTSSEQESPRISFQLEDVDAQMTSDVGGKAANLGEVSKLLPSTVPPGFVITTGAYRLFIQENRLNERIRVLLKDISLISDPHLLKSRLEEIRDLIQNSPVPAGIADAIREGVSSSPAAGRFWAVRSSAWGEDGQLSYAGQFDSILSVPVENLPDAYRRVLASRYSDRAVQYRIAAGSAEVDTPMAVLFMPMIAARSAGVLYTREPDDGQSDRMLINAVSGLAEQMVQGHVAAAVFLASRKEPGVLIERHPGDAASAANGKVSLSPADVKVLVESALKIERHFGNPQDIEWAIDEQGKPVILQARQLRLTERGRQPVSPGKLPPPLASGGTTIFAGRAVGEAWIMRPGRNLDSVPEAALVIVDQATPELGVVLSKIAGLVATFGNPAGHAATLIREFAVPCVFGMASAIAAARDGQLLSLDATRRALYDGVIWPDVQDRVRRRVRNPVHSRSTGFLNERILALNLVDPLAASFRPRSCRSIHDVVRFVHEKGVGTMFDLGDRQSKHFGKSAAVLQSEVPLNLLVLDLGGGISSSARETNVIKPADVISLPFQALWRGVTSPGIKWTGRTRISAAGFASVIASSLAQGGGPARGLGSNNYLMVGNDYVCLNARLAYHFTMIDAMVSDAAENNYVNFRFRGGGAGADRRSLRAQFLANVLLRSSFGVNRQGDLVTAWMRRYPRDASEQGLSLIGKLMGCARQLDMILNSSNDVREYVEKFLQGDCEAFA
jgi:pyruvate,water dikinase